jgi:4-amino-4-deoxy-L-arabinose transferase-like glycosyltransferase
MSAGLGRVLNALTLALIAVFAVPLLFVASVLPYRFWDSLAFGTWSRLIGERGHLWFPDDLFDSQASRPLFYVGQGLAWLAFGYHEWLGRWISALFALVFAVCVVVLAGWFARDQGVRPLMRALAAAVALGSAVLAAFAAAGMSDVPLAAAVALTAVLLWSPKLGRLRLPLVALAAAAAVLSKPSAYLALLGLALALLVDVHRETSRRRAAGGLIALASGAALGVVYDAVMAGKFDESLSDFVRSGNTTFFLQAGSRARWDAVLRAEWLGAEVRLVLLYGVVYCVARALGGRGRLAAALAAPAALVWSIAGPVIADGGTPYPFDNGLSLGLVAWLGLAAAIGAAPFVAQPEVLRRADFAALALWALPSVVAWVAYRPDQVRFLSPVWAPLVLATAGALASLTLGLGRLRPAAAAVPIVASSLLVFANVPNVDGLGGSGWHGLLDLGWSGWGSRAATENFAYGPLSYEIDAARANLGDGQLVSSDGRLAYFFPGRTDIRYARSCESLRGRRVFILLTSGESAEIMTRVEGSSADPLAWIQCASPRLYAVQSQPGINETFVVGRPPAATPDPSACRITAYPGQLSDAVFAEGLTYARARAIREAAAKVGFGPIIERTGCSTFRVVLTGVPDDARKSFTKEAAGAGFRVRIVPAVRYPEVAPDVPAMG